MASRQTDYYQVEVVEICQKFITNSKLYFWNGLCITAAKSWVLIMFNIFSC